MLVNMTVFETEKHYQDSIAEKKTIGSKKSFLTKSLKQEQSFLDDLIEARTHKSQMLHGERVTYLDVLKQTHFVKIVTQLRKSLNS